MGIDYKLIPDRTLTRLFSVENIERTSSEDANCSSGVCWVPHHWGIAFPHQIAGRALRRHAE
jgi:hypothetical protein